MIKFEKELQSPQQCRFFCESEAEELLPLPPPDRGQFCVPQPSCVTVATVVTDDGDDVN